ncbi:MAG: redoxin domain-containing protein [Cytophagaceae bacterium]|nr:redoxin domain-containing protein [Cytophagaceae bacterium]MDW8455488.1 redoxin domain-containing protein [Cytophagaceae bacterium]
MKKKFTAFILGIMIVFAKAQYSIGDKVADLKFLNPVNNSIVELSNFKTDNVLVIVFTSHNCPYSRLYEERLTTLIKTFNGKGVTFLYVNPNNAQVSPEDSPAEIAKVASSGRYAASYLIDPDHKAADAFGATKTPEVFVLKNNAGTFVLRYKGAIDDNPQVAKDVSVSFLKNAIEQLVANTPVTITEKKASGCMIKR